MQVPFDGTLQGMARELLDYEGSERLGDREIDFLEKINRSWKAKEVTGFSPKQAKWLRDIWCRIFEV